MKYIGLRFIANLLIHDLLSYNKFKLTLHIKIRFLYVEVHIAKIYKFFLKKSNKKFIINKLLHLLR
jgi:hypothetical protein